jgi:hypothetical protein
MNEKEANHPAILWTDPPTGANEKEANHSSTSYGQNGQLVRMKRRRIIQPILWTERPTGAVMGADSLWPSSFSSLPKLHYNFSNEGGKKKADLEHTYRQSCKSPK